jgi:hypothetical protein
MVHNLAGVVYKNTEIAVGNFHIDFISSTLIYVSIFMEGTGWFGDEMSWWFFRCDILIMHYLYSSCKGVLLEKLIVTQSRNSPPFTEPESSLLYSWNLSLVSI